MSKSDLIGEADARNTPTPIAKARLEPRPLEERIRKELQLQARRAGFGVLVKYFRIKKFKVVCPTTQTALAVDVLVDALRRVPAEVAEAPGFGAKVALIAGAIASNVVSDANEAEAAEDEDSREPGLGLAGVGWGGLTNSRVAS